MTQMQSLLSFDKVLNFDGDDYIEIKDPFANSTEFTISLWLKPGVLNSGWHGFIGKQGDKYRKPGMWICPDNNGLYCDSYDNAGIRYGNQFNNFFTAKDQWVHIAWVKKGNQYSVYRNGELFATKPAPENFYSNKETSYWLGRVDNFLIGKIADVQIWSVARTQEEIQKQKGTRLTGKEAGLVGYWPLNDGSGNTIADKTGKGNTGTINGATWQEEELPVQPTPASLTLKTNSKIKLKSWKGDYLHRPDSPQGVTTWNMGIGNEWIVESIGDNKIKLKSWKGDYLHRPDSPQGVTTWDTGIGNEWIVESIGDNKIKLKSWKGDYLHRPDSPQGVTTWNMGIGNEWIIEVISTPEPATSGSKVIEPLTGGNAIDDKPYVDSRNNFYIVDTNNSINGNGEVTGWEIWAKTTLPAQLVIYRKSGDSWSVVGKSEVKTPVVGLNQFSLAPAITVQKGDFVGIYYPQAGSISFSKPDPQAWDIGNLTGKVLFTGTGATPTAFSGSSNRIYAIRVKGNLVSSSAGTQTAVTKVGKIVVNADEWTLGNDGFKNAADAGIFAANIAKWFTGGRAGKFHAYSTNFGVTQSALAETMTKAGHTWTTGLNIKFDLPTLLSYDGIFVGGNAADNQVLIEYVKAGGNVYLMAGTGVGGAQAEADCWNTFLAAFGFKFSGQYNNVVGNQPVNSSHPILAGVKSLYLNNGNSITDLVPNDPKNIIVLSHSSGQGLIATFEGTVSQPEPTVAPAQPEPTVAPAQPEPTVAPAQPEPTVAPAQPEPSTGTDGEPAPTGTATGDVAITQLVYKGKVKRTQSDEYIEITNKGSTPADLSGWKVTSAASKKQVFNFPKGTVLQPGKSFRIYTNEVHPETGGFSFGSATAIWNDKGDEAKVFDAQGNNVSTLAYGINSIGGIKVELGIPQLLVEVNSTAINKQMALVGKVTFTEALKQALVSFIEDDTNPESPLAQILKDPTSFELPAGADKAAAIKKLRSYVNQATAKIILQTANSDNLPEAGEKVEANWIFQLQLKEIGGLYWAIVDRSGAKPAYNYGVS